MSYASQGRAREHRVRDAMILCGWEYINRSAGSKGAMDIIMAHEIHGQAFVQVGTGSKSLGPTERARLLRAAYLCSALPIVAQVIPRAGIRWWLVTDKPASGWVEWSP